MIMADVTIIVENGRIDTVYSENKELDVHVIDLDETNPTLLDELKAEAKEVAQSQHIVW